MTYPKNHAENTFLHLRSKKRLRWLTGLSLCLLVPLAIEISRWHTLPTENYPISVSGEKVGQPEAQAALQSIATLAEAEPITGLAVAVAIGGEVIWCSAQGYAELESLETLTCDHSMRLGSVTKPLTSLLLARLLDQQLVDLDQPIGEKVPELPKHLHRLTLRQLASHTAGIRHYHRWIFRWPPHETWSRRAYGSATESLSIFAQDPLLFEPGTGFRYSTHSFTLLGAVLEKVTGKGYDELFEREIVSQLGLQSTGLDSPIPEPGTAHSYEIAYGRYRRGLTVNSSRCWPGGGVRSSANDLAQLISALPQGHLISQSSLETLLTPQNLHDGSPNPQNYALGWRLVQTQDFLNGQGSYRLAHHGGVASGGSSFVAFFPDQSLAVVVLTNTRTGSRPLGKLALEIAEPFMAAHLGLEL